MKIVIIGKGNVGNFLYGVLRSSSECVFLSHDEVSGSKIEADCIIYTICDSALSSIIANVVADEETLHVHTSGTMPLAVFGEDKPHCAAMYPLQTFTKGTVIVNERQIPYFLELRLEEDRGRIEQLVRGLTSKFFYVCAQQRQMLHLCGVFANNFPNLMFHIADCLVKSTGFDFSILYPLIEQTIYKVRTMTPYEAQSGPARRHDDIVIQKHLSVLKEEEVKKIYEVLSDYISGIYRKSTGQEF